MSRSHHRRRKKGPGLFSEIGKEARGLLRKGYSCNQQFSISTYSDTELTLTSSIVKRQGNSSGSVAAQYKYNNTTVDVVVNTRLNNISATLTHKDILPYTNIIASYRLPNYHELVVQQLYEHAAFTVSLAVKQSPEVKFSATVGTPDIAFGVEGKYITASSLFTEYNAVISVRKRKMGASISLLDKGDLLNLSYIRYLNWPKRISAILDVTRRLSINKNTFTVGGSCVLDHLTLVKMNLNNHGILQTFFEHKIRPKTYLTISGDLNIKALDKTPRIGLALALKL